MTAIGQLFLEMGRAFIVAAREVFQHGDRRNEDEPICSSLGQFVDEGLNFCLVPVGKLVRLKHRSWRSGADNCVELLLRDLCYICTVKNG